MRSIGFQVSGMRMDGKARKQEWVNRHGFDKKAFLSLTYHQPVSLTARARLVCTEPMALEAAQFDPEAFIALCNSWSDLLQAMS